MIWSLGWRLFLILAALGVSQVGRAAMALSDQLLSPNFFASQGALVSVQGPDALSWVQSPSILADVDRPHVSSGIFLVAASLDPDPREVPALGAAVIGIASPLLGGAFGVALSMPLGQNVWVDTGARESSALFTFSRLSAFSVGLGWGREWQNGWAAGLQIPILFRSNTTTDIYLLEENPWARARTGVKPYFGFHLGLRKEFASRWRAALSYREEQASKIEFGVRGEVDFAGITMPLDASGFSEILFEPRRADLQLQKEVGPWLMGFFARWSNWRSAPPLGLVIDSKIPAVTTEASRVRWQDQWEIATSVAHRFTCWVPVASYRFRSRAVLNSNDYWDYDEHVLAVGAHGQVFSDDLWISSALRVHKLVGSGFLTSFLFGLDWAL